LLRGGKKVLIVGRIFTLEIWWEMLFGRQSEFGAGNFEFLIAKLGARPKGGSP
jgi:hypothetical protein